MNARPQEVKREVFQAPQIRSIEIRTGNIETFRVTMEVGGVVVVDATMLNDFRLFNRESIFQIRRSFPEPEKGVWSEEVDRALRSAIEPAPPEGEQLRFHGTSSWGNVNKPWLVHKRLPEQGVGLISGLLSMFKSFTLVDMCGSVMTGLPCLKSRTTRRSAVLIFAAEGAGDIPMRMDALVKHRLQNEIPPDLFAERQINLGRLPFSYAGDCRALLNPRTVDWIIGKARQAQTYFNNEFGLDLGLIGIDTMSAAAGWDSENDAAKVQIVMNHLKEISVATNTCVAAVDHFGKDISAGTRGSIVKESSADFILATLGEIDPETRVVTDSRVVLRKLRSGPDGLVFPFTAKLVEMGLDQYGEPDTSRVLDWNVTRPDKPAPRTTRTPREQTTSEAETTMMRALVAALAAHGEPITVDGVEVKGVKKDHVDASFDKIYTRNRDGVTVGTLRKARWAGREAVEGKVGRDEVDGVEYWWWPPGMP